MVQQTGGSPRVVIAGADGVGKKSLARQLLEVESLESPAEGEAHGMAWTLDTKYYTAGVELDLRSVAQAEPRALPATTEAVILMVDASRPETWAAARAWVASSPGIDSLEIRLCVLNKMDLSTPGVAWVKDLLDWCLDEMFECIQVCCTDSTVDTGLESDGDAQGVARVVQALQAHMWPGLRMKDRTDPDSSDSRADATAQVAAQDPDTDRQAEDWSSIRVQTDALASSGGAPHQAAPGLQYAVGTNTADMEFADDGDGDEFREMEALMMRLTAEKSKLAGLPDDERRERAAELAMQLASMMGLDEDEEEDEDQQQDKQ